MTRSDAGQDQPLEWFQGYGLEIEYMVVDHQTLQPLAKVPEVLESLDPKGDGTVELGPIAWSNELAAHVIELKCNGPVPDLATAAREFPRAVNDMNEVLAGFGARLLPSAMHPWMNPETDFRLYPVDAEGIYSTFDTIFDCRGHGWSNLQSMHINLPFRGDEQLAKLHSAVRLLLPLLPALAASSPVCEGQIQPELDHRLVVYRDNAHRVPAVSGRVVPEHIAGHADYQRDILEVIYAALQPLDPDGTLRHEWVNARGCIARFDRSALEIRVLDSQESPRADLAVAFAVCSVLENMITKPDLVQISRDWSEARLAGILWDVAKEAQDTTLRDLDYLRLWGVPVETAVTAKTLWLHLLDQLPPAKKQSQLHADAAWLLEHGCLASRILKALGPTPTREALTTTYAHLADCLKSNSFFEA